MERSCILDMDYYDCEIDWCGSRKNKVCLPERRGRAYWLYHIDHSETVATRNEPQSKAITSTRFISPGSMFSDPASCSREPNGVDIVQYGVDMTSLHKELQNQTDKDLRFILCAFTIPNCRNPRSKSSNSVRNHEGQNYLSMCGEFG